MKRIVCSGIAAVVCGCVLIAGCAKPPKEEAVAADAAITSAKAAKAHLFAAEQFKAAQDKFNAAHAEIKAQEAKLPFSRDYEKARKLLAEATAAADAAKAAVAENRVKISGEVKELLEKAKAAVEESKKMVEGLLKKKNKEAATLKTKLESTAVQLPADISKVTEDDMVATRDAIKDAIISIESVKSSIEKLGPAKAPPQKTAVKKGGRKR